MKKITFNTTKAEENEKLPELEKIEKLKKVQETLKKNSKIIETAFLNFRSQLMEMKYSAEYLENFDSIKSFLNGKGLISPKNRKEFFDWYFKQIASENPELKVSDLDSFPKLERIDIIKFSKLLTSEIESELLKKNNKSKEKQEESRKNVKLIDCFKSVSDYSKIMLLLSNKELIEPNTHFWINSKAANKAFIVNLIKALQAKGYFKKEISLNYKLAKSIILNTFNVEIKSNRTYYKEVRFQYYDFIPIKSENTD